MTASEIELSRKLLNTQQKLVKIEDRVDKLEAVLDAICIKRRYKLIAFLRDFVPSWRKGF